MLIWTTHTRLQHVLLPKNHDQTWPSSTFFCFFFFLLCSLVCNAWWAYCARISINFVLASRNGASDFAAINCWERNYNLLLAIEINNKGIDRSGLTTFTWSIAAKLNPNVSLHSWQNINIKFVQTPRIKLRLYGLKAPCWSRLYQKLPWPLRARCRWEEIRWAWRR